MLQLFSNIQSSIKRYVFKHKHHIISFQFYGDLHNWQHTMALNCFQTTHQWKWNVFKHLSFHFCDDFVNLDDQSKIGTCEKGFIANQFCFHFIHMLALQNTKCMWILMRCIIAFFHIFRPPSWLFHLDPSQSPSYIHLNTF